MKPYQVYRKAARSFANGNSEFSCNCLPGIGSYKTEYENLFKPDYDNLHDSAWLHYRTNRPVNDNLNELQFSASDYLAGTSLGILTREIALDLAAYMAEKGDLA